MSTPTLTLLSRTSDTTPSPSCTTAVPDSCGHVPVDACNSYYSYDPIFAANTTFAALFGITTLAHITQAILHRKGFCWVIIMGSAWEFIAFVTHALGAREQQNMALAVVSPLMLALAPLWVNAFVYMVAGRLIHGFHPQQRVWKIKGISIGKYFVWLDIVCFIVQGTGASMLNPGNGAKTIDLGIKIYMSGVGFQQGFIVLFIGVIVLFHRTILGLTARGEGPRTRRWMWLTCVLYFTLTMISCRIIFRLIEYSRGMTPDKNPIPFHQGYMLGLDALPMFLGIAALNIFHPGLALNADAVPFPTRREKKELKKAAKAEKKRSKQAKGSQDDSSDHGSDTELMKQTTQRQPQFEQSGTP